jgi:hypothetical protein
MKNSNMIHTIQRVAVIGLLGLLLSAAVNVVAKDKIIPNKAQSALAQDLIGTWILVGKPGEVGEIPASGGRLKFFTGKHWMITQPNAETGVTIFHHGGTYILNGNEYVETIDYANESTKEFIKKTNKFTIKVEGDTMTQIGIGNPFNEVWKRLK